MRDRPWAYAGLTVVAGILLVTSPVSDFNRFLVIVVLTALGAAWIELMRRQTRREFPHASGAALLADAQTRISGWWQAMRTRSEVRQSRAAPAADIAARLASLADLHTRGELTDEEYAAAKARVLADG